MKPEQEQSLEQEAYQKDYNRPCEQVGGIKVDFGLIEVFTDRAFGNPDHLGSSARLPAKPQRNGNSRTQIGKYLRKIDVPYTAQWRHAEQFCHLEQLWIGTSDSFEQVGIDDRQYHQK